MLLFNYGRKVAERPLYGLFSRAIRFPFDQCHLNFDIRS